MQHLNSRTRNVMLRHLFAVLLFVSHVCKCHAVTLEADSRNPEYGVLSDDGMIVNLPFWGPDTAFGDEQVSILVSDAVQLSNDRAEKMPWTVQALVFNSSSTRIHSSSSLKVFLLTNSSEPFRGAVSHVDLVPDIFHSNLTFGYSSLTIYSERCIFHGFLGCTSLRLVAGRELPSLLDGDGSYVFVKSSLSFGKGYQNITGISKVHFSHASVPKYEDFALMEYLCYDRDDVPGYLPLYYSLLVIQGLAFSLCLASMIRLIVASSRKGSRSFAKQIFLHGLLTAQFGLSLGTNIVVEETTSQILTPADSVSNIVSDMFDIFVFILLGLMLYDGIPKKVSKDHRKDAHGVLSKLQFNNRKAQKWAIVAASLSFFFFAGGIIGVLLYSVECSGTTQGEYFSISVLFPFTSAVLVSIASIAAFISGLRLSKTLHELAANLPPDLARQRERASRRIAVSIGSLLLVNLFHLMAQTTIFVLQILYDSPVASQLNSFLFVFLGSSYVPLIFSLKTASCLSSFVIIFLMGRTDDGKTVFHSLLCCICCKERTKRLSVHVALPHSPNSKTAPLRTTPHSQRV